MSVLMYSHTSGEAEASVGHQYPCHPEDPTRRVGRRDVAQLHAASAAADCSPGESGISRMEQMRYFVLVS